VPPTLRAYEKGSSMQDVKQTATAPATTGTGGETETPSQSDTQQTEQTTVGSEGTQTGVDVKTAQQIEKTIPYSRFREQNQRLREAERRLAEQESRSKLSKYNPNDVESIMAHPIVQELMLKDAKRELTDYTRGLLDQPQYATVHPSVKKAILANVRGWVKESTTDVETAKIDISEAIDGLIEEATGQPQTFPVSQTNTGIASPGTKPAEVARIINQPVDEITDDEAKSLKNYRQR